MLNWNKILELRLKLLKLLNKIQEDLSDKIDLQYKIEVEVMSEKEQESLYNKLTKDGYVCRILTL